jgi:preprotein translocase subunit SecE
VFYGTISSVRQTLSYISEVRSELTKITWPKRDEVVRLTLTVFAISAVVGAYLGALDLFFTKILEIIISK